MSGAANPFVIDPLLTAEENFFASIRVTNPNRTIRPEMVTLSLPTPYVSGADPWYNTEITLRSRPGFRLTGDVVLHYHRDRLDVLGTEFTYPYDYNLTLGELLVSTALKLGLVPTELEFDITDFPAAVEGQPVVTVGLKALSRSLLYIGSVSVNYTGVVAGIIRRTEDGMVRYEENGTVRIVSGS